jgi:O-methyltransferase
MELKNKSIYIELLKKSLIGFQTINSYEYLPISTSQVNKFGFLLQPFNKVLNYFNFEICKKKFVDESARLNGRDWPANADTMIGLKRLNNIEFCINSIIEDKIEGDFIETGVWRGGATILMKALLKVNEITNKKVWVADSFKGLPKPDAKNYKHDAGVDLYKIELLSVSLDQVKNNFSKYDLLDEQVVFLEGWFKDTLPNSPIEKLSLLRLDGDLYESTIQALENLYPKLSIGGFVIIDDYNAIESCKKAVIDYRNKHNISEEVIDIDNEGVYWRKVD